MSEMKKQFKKRISRFGRVRRGLSVAFLLVIGVCLDLQAASVRSHIVWAGDEARLQVRVDPGPAAAKQAETTVNIAVRPVNQRGESLGGFVTGHSLKLAGAGKRVTETFPLLQKGTSKDRLWTTYYRAGGRVEKIPGDYVRVTVRNNALGLSSEELIYPFKGSTVHSCTVHLAGEFGSRKASFSLYFGPHGKGVDQKVDLEFHLLDSEGNELSGGEEEIWLANDEPTLYEKDITPDRNSTGPYALTFTLNNEALGIAMAGEARFPFATFLVPVTSMESDTTADWHLPGKPLDSRAEKKVPIRPAFDSKVLHSGAQSLRIDYSPTGKTTIGSNIRLPGLPTAARIWVKGNKSRDRLVIEWRDPCTFTAASYQRWMNSMAVEICRLNFSDWRMFTVPMLGNGLLGRDTRSYLRGHSGIEVAHPVQAPLYCAALRVIPERLAKGAKTDTAMRSVWVDDILVETQALRGERMALELRGDTAARTLHADAKLFVSVGNGTGNDIRNGRVTVTFLDGDEKPVQGADLAEGINVPAGEFTTRVLSLTALIARKPRGPVTAVVTVAGPVAGQRVKGRLVFNRPTGTGLFWDFERLEHFNSPAPRGMGADPVTGGADGSAHALPLNVTTNLLVSVLLHPSLPGIVEGVEMQVFGDGTPVLLQAIFADSGPANLALAFQQFAAGPVRVDWKGWKTCRFTAPAIPPRYATGTGNPLYAPAYPLNLVLKAWTEDEHSAVIRVDQVKVSTHLAKQDELITELQYPDETLMHIAGSPLKLRMGNFSSQPMALNLAYSLTTPVGSVAEQGTRKVTLNAGARDGVVLVDKLNEGFYRLRVEVLSGGRIFEADVQVPDRKRYFGDALMSRLSDIRGLNRDLGLNEKRVNLDWDTAEPVPNMVHHDWFRRYTANESEGNTYDVVPVVGYAADWAGPEKREALADASYTRTVGNYMQTPVRLVDWNVFMRNVGREHAKDFKKWVFWQSPDMEELPIYLPPAKYRAMFEIFDRWISLYNSEAGVVAGGFRFDRVLGYLADMQEPHTLPFDLFEIRMNPGSVSVEEVQMEDFLEDLDATLKLRETGRKAAVVELDWVTDERLGLLDQAAYHARAAVLLHAVGALPHQFKSVNKRNARDGFGLLYRPSYGNSSIQQQRPFYVPKPAYFGLIETRKMLADLEFMQRVTIADRDPQANRAYLFKQKAGGICAAIWRVQGAHTYDLPAKWTKVEARDAFGVPVALNATLPVGPMPLFLYFSSVPVDRVAHELRNLRLRQADRSYQSVLDFFVAEDYSRKAAQYKVTGGEKVECHSARLPAGERVRAEFLKDVTEEQFAFQIDKPGDVLMSRLWYLHAGGETDRTLKVALNGVGAQTWSLAPAVGLASSNNFDKVYASGPRRSVFVLRGCRAGRNEVTLRHSAPSSSGGFRLTRIPGGRVELTACGPLASMDSGVPVQIFRNATGGPLVLGKQTYAFGLGCMGQTALEYPLNKQFSKFTVTVGIDTIARGRGSVGFRILVDGEEKARSGPMTGMTLAKKLEVDGLEDAERLLLLVDDAGDGSEKDLADWVEPVLYLKELKNEN